MLTPHQAIQIAASLGEQEAASMRGATLAGHPGDAEEVPAQIDSFRVIRQIGRGGMGTVYEAEQKAPRRRVAVKVLHSGLTSTAAQKRFQHEAQILAHLRHPNIAHVYESGSYDDGSGGRPYFVMEFIPGAISVTSFAEQHDLSVEERIELFLLACEAVSYGHQKGIIHRDLSPANILVHDEELPPPPSAGGGEDGENRPTKQTKTTSRSNAAPSQKPSVARRLASRQVKIIDFGIARVTDADLAVTTIHTSMGELIGTIQYMSPEQCEGNALEVDTRTDVYSLGVVLYELLTDHLPYDLSYKSLPSATRIIQDTDPVRPSTHYRRLRGNLDTIIAKAIAKEPASRYQSVADLAHDLHRHLNGDPIEAKAPRAWHRFGRWVGRHPIAATLCICALVLVCTITGTMGSVWWLNARPHRVEIIEFKDSSRRGSALRILAKSGRELDSLESQFGSAFASAFFVDAIGSRGGRHLAVGVGSQNEHLQPGIHIFDLARLDWTQPLKSISIDESWLPSTAFGRKLDVDKFHVSFAWPKEMFSDSPGEEIVAVFQHGPHSQCCVIVLGSNGSMLYRFWHEGNVNDFWFDEASNRMLLAAIDAECEWTDRDVEGMPQAYPRCVFALDPVNGAMLDWVKSDGSEVLPAWYKFFLPAYPNAPVQSLRFQPPERWKPQGSVVRIIAHFDSTFGPSMSLLIDADGVENVNARIITDQLKLASFAPPDLTIFRLQDANPCTSDD